MNNQTLLKVASLTKRFGQRIVLQDIDLELQSGRSLLLSGLNGAGKTTLLRILAGLEKPDHGTINFGREPTSWYRAKRTLLEQTLYLHQHPYMFDGSVRYNLAYALPRGLPKQVGDERVDRALAWAALEHLQEMPAKTLSGGERQRVSLARAWLRNPRILLLDEPTANLDQASRQLTLQLLEPLKTAGMSLVLATHDPSHLSSLVDSYLHLHNGRVTETDPLKIMPIAQTQADVPLRSSA